MSMHKMLGALSIACALTLVGCDEEEGPTEDAGDEIEGRDAGKPKPRTDAGRDQEDEDDEDWDEDEPSADAGTPTNSRPDAGMGSDSGNNNNGDNGNSNTSADGGTRTDAGKDGGSTSDGGLATSGKGLFFFLPTGEPDNTSAAKVEVDTQGNTHSVFPAYAGGDAYYSLCKSDGSCKGSDSAQFVHFETDTTVADAMIALTADGRPRILLASYSQIYFGSCEANCGTRASWTFGSVLKHDGKRQVTGEALALDPQGRPRFLMHTYRAFLGIGQETPEEIYAQCDQGCESAANWRFTTVSTGELWVGSNLRFDAQGHPHVATTVVPFEGNQPKGDPVTAYLSCNATDCAALNAFNGTGFYAPFESNTEAVTMYPATSLALTKSGAPRVALIAKSAEGKKQLIYFACDSNCQMGKSWSGTILTQHDAIGAGVDLALDTNDHPRLVYTFNYNILLRFCDEKDCTTETAKWDDGLVESSRNIPPDHIFLWENCTIGAWFLHDPSIALTTSGLPRVGYQARDVSGGFTRPDPTKPGCTPGTDMTFARLAVMDSVN